MNYFQYYKLITWHTSMPNLRTKHTNIQCYSDQNMFAYVDIESIQSPTTNPIILHIYYPVVANLRMGKNAYCY